MNHQMWIGLATAGLLAGCPADPGGGADSKKAAQKKAPTQAAPVPDAPAAGKLTIYSGRSKSLVEAIINKFAEQSKIEVDVRYGKTAAMAGTILEEGDNSPADVFLAQDSGALGVLADKGRFRKLSDAALARVDGRFKSAAGLWVGVSGRARVVAYSTARLRPEQLPKSIDDLTDPKWKGKIGWPPTNASFQAFVTALRLKKGEEGAKAWLEAMKKNEPKVYPKNTPIIKAIADGEVDLGLVNHYYLYRFLAEQGDAFPVRNHYLPGGDPGALVNLAGVGILKTTKNHAAAAKFVDFLLAEEAQAYFTKETYEFPLVKGVAQNDKVKTKLADIQSPDIDLNQLSSLEATLALLRQVKVLN